MQQAVIDILTKEAEDRGMPFPVIKEIYLSQFKNARKYMSAGERNKPETFHIIRIPFLGKFQTKESRISRYIKEDELQENKD